MPNVFFYANLFSLCLLHCVSSQKLCCYGPFSFTLSSIYEEKCFVDDFMENTFELPDFTGHMHASFNIRFVHTRFSHEIINI